MHLAIYVDLPHLFTTQFPTASVLTCRYQLSTIDQDAYRKDKVANHIVYDSFRINGLITPLGSSGSNGASGGGGGSGNIRAHMMQESELLQLAVTHAHLLGRRVDSDLSQWAFTQQALQHTAIRSC